MWVRRVGKSSENAASCKAKKYIKAPMAASAISTAIIGGRRRPIRSLYSMNFTSGNNNIERKIAKSTGMQMNVASLSTIRSRANVSSISGNFTEKGNLNSSFITVM